MAGSSKLSARWATALLALVAGFAVLLTAQSSRAAACQFRRGVNLPLEFTGWQYGTPAGRAAAAARIRNVAAAGFDFVRVLVNFKPLLTGTDAGAFVAQLVDFARQASDAHLCVVFAPRSPEWDPAWRSLTVFADPAKTARYRAPLIAIAQALARDAPGTALELLNEPPAGCKGQPGTAWNRVQADLYHAVRQVAPRQPVLLTGECWSSIDGLVGVNGRPFAADPNAFFTFHFYEPQQFAEQGSTKRCPTPEMSRVPYPATASCEQTAMPPTEAAIAAHYANTPEGKRCAQAAKGWITDYCRRLGFPEHIRQRIDLVRRWAQSMGIAPGRIILGEFGANAHGAWADRLRWLADVRRAAEADGFGWAVWALGGAFTIECPGGPADQICPAARQALGLR